MTENPYNIDELHKAINKALTKPDYTYRDMEVMTNCRILHKIVPIIKRKNDGKLPQSISRTEAQIILGELRSNELSYRKWKNEQKKGQKSLTEFTKKSPSGNN